MKITNQALNIVYNGDNDQEFIGVWAYDPVSRNPVLYQVERVAYGDIPAFFNRNDAKVKREDNQE